MALLGDGVIISGGTTSMSDLDRFTVYASVLLLSGTAIPGGATSMSDLDKVAIFASSSLGSTAKTTLGNYSTPENIRSTQTFTKTGV